MSDSKAYGPYAATPIAAGAYLDIMKIRPVPAASDDIVYEITPSYTHRPDLLAYDLYGQKELWWIFAQRNLDVIKDPIYDFVAGTKIYLPQGQKLTQYLGQR